MSKIKLIIEREYLTRVYKKSFILMTILTPVIFIALAFVPAMLSKVKDTNTKTIAVIDKVGKYADLIHSNETYQFIPIEADNESAQEYYERESKGLYGVLMITGDLLQNPGAITFYSEKTATVGLKDRITKPINEYLREEKIESFNIPELKKIISNLDVNIKLSTVKWGEDGQSEETSADLAMIIGFLFTFLIYMFIFAYGSMVINSVIQEKTNRIVEVIISSVKPFELMMGKIIAIACVGLTQFVIWIAFVVIAFNILGMGLSGTTSDMPMDGALMDSNMSNFDNIMADVQSMLAGIDMVKIVGAFILYFIGGYLLYASIFAAIGSVVDQEEDTQQFMIPVTMIILFAFYAATYSLENPEGPLAYWCSMIPFTSPIVMMVRIPYDVPFWEIALSVSILFATFIVTTYFSAKIYRTGILMYGKKVSIKEIIKWLRY